MSAIVAGHFKDFTVVVREGEMHFYGPARQINYYCADRETPPPAALCFLSVYRQQSRLMRNNLLDWMTLYEINRSRNAEHERELADRWDELQAICQLTGRQKDDRWELFISLMLKATDFDLFWDFLNRHFLADIEYLITIPFHGFGVPAENQLITTKDEFYTGKPYLVPNGEISFLFRHSTPRG